MPSAEARLRLLFTATLLVPASLAAVHIVSPSKSASLCWGGARCSSDLPFGLLGSWWAAAAICSAFGLRDPLKWSPIAVLLISYKLCFFFSSILPLMLAGRGGEIPLIPALVYFSFLPVMFACTPWAYLFTPSSSASAGGGGKEPAINGKME